MFTLQLQTNNSGMPNNLRIRFNADGSMHVGSTRYTMEDFASKFSGFEPFCRFVVPVDGDKEPFELLSQTAAGRITAPEHAARASTMYPLTVVFLPETASLKDARWRLIAAGNADGSHELDLDFTPDSVSVDSMERGAAAFNWMPSLDITQTSDLTVTGYATFSIQYNDPDGVARGVNCDVRVKSNAGYLPKSKVELKNGVGTFKVYGLGLDTGDTVVVKAGIGEWSALGVVATTVV